jgi:hypothetical protein
MSTLPITVITPSLPERSAERNFAIASVLAQSLQPAEHLVLLDYQRVGGHRPLNVLAQAVQTEWMQILCDDDALLPNHFEQLWPLCADADIVFSPAVLLGNAPWEGYNEAFDGNLLRTKSIVPHNALVRTEMFKKVGGWTQESGYDWTFWVRCLDAGARFARYPDKTWIYDLRDHVVHESRP